VAAKLDQAERDATRDSDECAFPNNTPLSAYVYGCRCLRCRIHQSEYQAAWHETHPEFAAARRKGGIKYRYAAYYGPPRSLRPWTCRTQYRHTKGYWCVSLGGLDHPLAGPDGLDPVAVHRLVVWEKLRGEDAPCHWCSDPLEWGSTLHVDHLDNDKDNNNPANLVPSCDKCNGSKGNSDRPRRLPNG
jgi:hypothetical protein